ncbi:ion channel [uncultured Cetobacterium sp.]|uniref:ion channel n=1 Tax=uncultured Cetobacterium sp. TaxID=527638 RepID=UPI00262C2DB2|nr:ion channel [uncultured Cetobacterium sp.]
MLNNLKVKLFSFLLKIKKFNTLSKHKIRTFSFFCSLILAGIELYRFNVTWTSKEFVLSSFVMIISIFITLYPFLYFFRPKFRIFLSDHIFFSMSLIIYFTLLIPILGLVNDSLLSISLTGVIIKFLHIITIMVSMLLIMILISRQFIMVIYKKRKIQGMDILTTFLTYIILGLAFGSFYYILNLMSSDNLFIGVTKPHTFDFENFLNHIYISLGTLSTVGTGTIAPINPYIRLISVMETILGIFLTSFSLGFIFSVLGSNSQDDIPSSDIPLEFSVWESMKKAYILLKNDLKYVEEENNKTTK